MPEGGSISSHTLISCEEALFNFRFPSANTKIQVLTERVSSKITYSATGSGTVTAFVGSSTLKSGGTVMSAVTFTGTPAAGYKLANWSVTDASGKQTIYADDETKQLKLNPVSSSYNVIANFVDESSSEVNKTVTITTPTHGTIEVRNASGVLLAPVNSVITVLVNSILTFTAVPSTIWSFGSWTGSLSGTTATQIKKVKENLTVGAEFTAPVWYTVYLSTEPNSGGGTLTAQDEDGITVKNEDTVPDGTKVTITAAPSASTKYHLKS